MKKTIIFALPLATIFLFVELSSSKPIDLSKNPEFHDVITKPAAGLPDHEIDSTASSYSDVKIPDSIDTLAPDVEKINGNLRPDKSNPPISRPITGEIESTSSKPGTEKPSRLPFTNMEPLESGNSDNSVTVLKPDYPGNPISTLEPVSGGKEAIGLVTSLESNTKDPDNLLTISEPGRLSSTVNTTLIEPESSLPTTLESDSGRRENSATTSIPDSHHRGDKLTNLPVTSANKNRASDIGSSWMMILLGIFLVAGSHVT